MTSTCIIFHPHLTAKSDSGGYLEQSGSLREHVIVSHSLRVLSANEVSVWGGKVNKPFIKS
jgi:hypothetical protein